MFYSLFSTAISCNKTREQDEEIESISDESNQSSYGSLRLEKEINFSESSGNSTQILKSITLGRLTFGC